MKVNRKEIDKNLPKKGFRREKDGHHIYFHHEYEGQDSGAYTFISHSSKFKDISGDVLLSIRKQLKLDTNRDAVNLIKCPIDEDTYNNILIKKNIIQPDE